MQYLQANWPQIRFADFGGTLASCTYLRAAPGEVIALAFDALQPGGPMKNDQYEWIQPPTRYNAVGVIEGPGGNAGTDHYRQPVTLERLRFLAALPPTDTGGQVDTELQGTGHRPADHHRPHRTRPRAVPVMGHGGSAGSAGGAGRASGGGSARRSSPERPEAGRPPGDRTRRVYDPRVTRTSSISTSTRLFEAPSTAMKWIRIVCPAHASSGA